MREPFRRIWYLFNRRRLEREMADEMAYHRELMGAERQHNFGSELRILENAREIWGWAWLDRLWQDLRYGSRVLRQSSGFTLTAMLILGLGIGAPLTAFRQAMYDLEANSAPDPDSLVQLTRRGKGLHITVLAYPVLEFYASHARSFKQVIGLSLPYQAVSASSAKPVRLLFATANYFPEFGIAPAAGRLFMAEDERLDTEPVAVVGEAFWRQTLGGDPGIVGQTIDLNGKAVRVVGVVPGSAKTQADVWMPLTRQSYVVEGSALLTDWNSALEAYARLRPGVSPKVAEEETRSLAASLHALRPREIREDEYLEACPILQFDRNGAEFQMALTAITLVFMLLVAACANLGILVLARGAVREREIRTRMALGAGRARVVRQLITEAVLLATVSGACALFFSTLVLKAIQLRHNSEIPMGLFPGWGVLGATAAAAIITALVFGLPPALRLTSLTPGAGRTRAIFLGTQVAASCMLLVVSSLLVGSMQRLRGNDPGFDFRHLVTISPGLKSHGYDGAAALAYLDTLRTRTVALPGVQAAGAAWLAPWGDVHAGTGWLGRQFASNHVDPNFLNTMGMRLVRGRNFRAGEEGVAIVTESAARMLWPDMDALGKTVPWDVHGPTVIGVVKNASTTAIGATEPLEYFLPQSQADARESVLVLRVSGDPRNSARLLQDAAQGIDSRLQPVVRPLSDSYDRESEKISRALAAIMILGAIALLLSSIGLAGLAGYTVAQRTRELGLRIALGARASQIIGAIVSPLGRPIAAGFLCGAIGGSAAVRVLRSGILGAAGLTSFDPLAYLAAMVFFIFVVALAVLAPARRALRINPSEALQHE